MCSPTKGRQHPDTPLVPRPNRACTFHPLSAWNPLPSGHQVTNPSNHSRRLLKVFCHINHNRIRKKWRIFVTRSIVSLKTKCSRLFYLHCKAREVANLVNAYKPMSLPLSTRERHLSVLLTANFRYHRSVAFMRRGKPGRYKRISGHSLCLLRKMRTPASITFERPTNHF